MPPMMNPVIAALMAQQQPQSSNFAPSFPGVSPQISQQLGILSQPDPAQQYPVPNDPKRWQMVLSMIGDALTATGSGFNPMVQPTQFLPSLQALRDRRQQIMAANEFERASAQSKARKEAAGTTIGILSEQEANKARAEEREARAREEAQKEEAKAAADRVEREFKAAEAERDRALRREIQVREEALRVRLAEMERSGGDKVENRRMAQEEREALKDAKARALTYRDKVASGEMSVDKARSLFQDEIEVDNSGDALAAAMAWFELKVASRAPASPVEPEKKYGVRGFSAGPGAGLLFGKTGG